MARGKKRKAAPGDIATNRQASHRDELLDRVEAGLVLQGTEVKALRAGWWQPRGRLRQRPRRRALLHNLHIALRPRGARQPRARAPAQAARPQARDRAPDRQDAGARADDRPHASVLQRPPGQGRVAPRGREARARGSGARRESRGRATRPRARRHAADSIDGDARPRARRTRAAGDRDRWERRRS